MYVDTHAHIYQEYYEDISEIMNNAKNVGIMKVINNGCNKKSNQEVLDLIQKFPNMYGALGIHPEEADDYAESDLIFVEENLNNPKVVAIGEIGLDYHYTKDNKEKQIKLFEYQLNLAQKYNKPVIIHSREATEDTINILKKYQLKGVIHAFSGSLETANIYIKMGFVLGVGGVLTFKNANLKDVIAKISLEHIVLETDSPYLTPAPYRGERNEPARIYEIAKFLADLKNIKESQVSIITNKNVQRIFDI